MWWFLVGVICFLCLLWLYGRYPFQSLSHIPGPPAKLFFGNLGDFGKGIPYYLVHDSYVKAYGSVSKHYLGRQGVVVIRDAALIKEFTVSSFDTFHNRPNDPSRTVRRSTSLLFARDEYWRRLRRTMSPTFNAAQMKNMIPHINEQLGAFLHKLQDVASSGKSVNIHALVGRLTLDVIGSVAFGAQLNVQNNQESPLVKAATGVLQASAGSVRSSAINAIIAMFPFLKQPIFNLFPSRQQKVLLSNAKSLDEFSNELLQSRRDKQSHDDSSDETAKRKKDFLDLLMQAADPETGKGMSDREILDQSNLFLLAGHETTANAIAYTIFLLAQHPEIDEELARECQALEEVSYKSLREMKLMNMVLKESMRLYPPVVLVRREVDKDTNLGGYFLPKGVWAVVPIWSLHYDEAYWKDATAFKPVERWSDHEATKDHAFHYLPFGAGPHGCIGSRFAEMEAVLILSQVLKHYRFSLEPGQLPLQLLAGITVQPKNGIHVTVHKRALFFK